MLRKNNSDAMFTNKSDEWTTPQDLYDELNKEFNFNLDPCATEKNSKCYLYYTKEQDGLSKDWGGTACFVIHHTAR